MRGRDAYTRKTVGRYHDDPEATTPGALPAAHAGIRHGVVPDPNNPGKRQRAAINTRVDLLEREYAAARLTEGAYRIGLTMQVALQRVHLSAGGQWMDGGRVDAASTVDIAIARAIDDAAHALAFLKSIRKIVGEHDTKLLAALLGEGLTIEDAIKRFGAPVTTRTISYQLHRFRDALEFVSEQWAAKGRVLT